MRTTLMVIALLVAVGTAQASDMICTVNGKLVYNRSVDPTPVPAGCSVIPDNITLAQRALIEQPALHAGAKCATIEQCYMKLGGVHPTAIVEEMTLSEKQAVDSTMQTAIDIATAKRNETLANEFCNNLTVPQIEGRIDQVHDNNQATIDALNQLETIAAAGGNPNIEAITNIATAKVYLTYQNNAYQTVLSTMNDRYMNAMEKITKCMWARTR